MEEFQKNISLKTYNTFGIDVTAKSFVEVTSTNQLKEILADNQEPLLILGGGSNILLTENYNGLVVKNNIKGINVVAETNDYVTLKVGGGENWHEFVMYCVDHNFSGIENLSLIPGSVGASPMQNIGAYGVEVKNVITEVEAFNLKDFSIKTFQNNECEFGYRSSIFKTSQKGNYFIISVTFKLLKKASLNTTYGAIEEELKVMGIDTPTTKDVSNAVIRIRQSKLPDPKEIGNSGSFFKNPIITKEHLAEVLINFEEAPHYLQEDGSYKIAAGWLIEQCGWKGKKIDNYGVHAKQALVLVNYGGSTGKDIFDLSTKIIESVKSKFKITLEREVNIL
jgi:UDP-N-acetylmuramate dehydrogenase